MTGKEKTEKNEGTHDYTKNIQRLFVFSRDKACILGGPLVMFLIVEVQNEA